MLSKLVSNEDAVKVEANQKHRTGEGWEMHSSEEAGMVKKTFDGVDSHREYAATASSSGFWEAGRINTIK